MTSRAGRHTVTSSHPGSRSSTGIEALRHDWDALLREPGSCVLLMEEKKEPVSFAAFGATRDQDDDPQSVGELYAIHLEPAAWGRGLGQALTAEVERRLHSTGFRAATLWVLDANARARVFYERRDERRGWREDGGQKLIDLGARVGGIRYRVSL